MNRLDDPYRGTVIVIPEIAARSRAIYGDFVVLGILIFNVFVIGVLLSWA
jgi:hypothetical protein